MPRISPIQQSEVDGVILDLLAAGAYPSAAHIRRLLGDRGSPPVLQRMIGHWYAENGPELGRKALAKPIAPTAGLRDALKDLTHQAISQIDAAQLQRKAELDDRAAALDSRGVEQDAFEASLKSRSDALDAREMEIQRFVLAAQQERADTENRLREAIAATSRAEGANEALTQRVGELEQDAADAAALARSLDDARSTIAREQERVMDLIKERKAATDRANDQQASLDRLAVQLGQMQDALAVSVGVREALQSRLDEAGAAVARHEAALAAEARACEAASQALQAMTAERDQARLAVASAEQARAALEARANTLVDALGRTEPLQVEMARLADQVKRLAAGPRPKPPAPAG